MNPETGSSIDSFFAEVKNDAAVVGRTKSQAETGAGLVYLHRYLRGGIRGVIGDLSVDRDPGSMYLMDQEQRVSCIQFPMTSQGVFIPKDLIGYDPDRHPAFVRFADNKTVNALLYRAFDHVFNDIRDQNIVNWTSLDRLIASLRYALGTDDSDGDIRRQAREAMSGLIREYVERNLDDADLSPTRILKAFGVSRASLFRMFENEGGVRRFINKRRLYRAVLDIARSARARLYQPGCRPLGIFITREFQSRHSGAVWGLARLFGGPARARPQVSRRRRSCARLRSPGVIAVTPYPQLRLAANTHASIKDMSHAERADQF